MSGSGVRSNAGATTDVPSPQPSPGGRGGRRRPPARYTGGVNDAKSTLLSYATPKAPARLTRRDALACLIALALVGVVVLVFFRMQAI